MILSIVVPVLNESRLIEEALTRLSRSLPEGVDWDIVVVDGGSEDDTVEKARSLCRTYSWNLIERKLSSPSVGRTVTEGVREARGKSVMVLPIDVQVSSRALQKWHSSIEEDGETTGGFKKQYSPQNPVLRFSAFLQNNIRSKWLRHLVWTNAFFFPASTSIPTEGFLEDVVLSDVLRKNPSWRFISEPVLVSSRRYYPRRSLFRTLLNISIVATYRLRLASVQKLKYLYYRLK